MAETPKHTPVIAIVALVLTAVSFLIGPAGLVTAVPGTVIAHVAKKRIEADPMLEGRNFAIAALVLGYCYLVLAGFVLLALVALIAL